MEQKSLDLIKDVQRALAEGRDGEVPQLLADLYPADIAEILYELDEEQRPRLLRLLDSERAALTLQEMDPEDQSTLLHALDQGQASEILEEMATDDIADLVGELPQPEAQHILELMDREEAEDVQELLEYPEDSAGGLMTFEYIAIHEANTAQEAIDKLRELAPDAETTYYLYVVDTHERLTGVVSLRDLIVAPPDRLISQIMRRNVISVHVDTDQEEVAKVVSKYHLLAVPVVNAAGVMQGIVTVDDVIDVIHEEATEDIYRLASAPGEEEDATTGVWEKAKKRLPWLFILLFGELLAASIIKRYDATLQSVLALAFFIPLLIGMAGNVGTQSLAVTVRGLATGELDRRSIWPSVMRESMVGVLIGAACGVLVYGVAWLWLPSGFEPGIVGTIVGLAMTLNLTVAAVLGTFVPFVLERFDVDPAVASGPFVTTALDVIGMVIYFLIATTLMSLLGVSLTPTP